VDAKRAQARVPHKRQPGTFITKRGDVQRL